MRPLLVLLLAVSGLVLTPQGAVSDEYNCEAVAHQVTYDYYTGECPVEGSGGCIGEITEENHTFQCIPDGYICYVPCDERMYYDYRLTHCECYLAGVKWDITLIHPCDICPGYWYPNYPWEERE